MTVLNLVHTCASYRTISCFVNLLDTCSTSCSCHNLCASLNPVVVELFIVNIMSS